MPLPTPPTLQATAASTARLQACWIAGFTVVSALMLAAGAWRHELDRQNPANDQPVEAQLVSGKIMESAQRFYVVGLARYSLEGRNHESEFVDTKDFDSADAAAGRLRNIRPPHVLKLYCQRLANADDPCALSLRLNLRVESDWAFFAVLIGGLLLFTGACIWPVNTYGSWAANKAPGWLRELGFLPLYLLLIPVVVGLMFLFEWYWGF